MNATELHRKLAGEGLFWSYNRNAGYCGDSLLIEHTLLYGEVCDLIELFKIFEFEKIKDVWNKKVVPDERFFGLNYYLAMVWFDIQEPEEYLKETAKRYSRYERIKSLE